MYLLGIDYSELWGTVDTSMSDNSAMLYTVMTHGGFRFENKY